MGVQGTSFAVTVIKKRSLCLLATASTPALGAPQGKPLGLFLMLNTGENPHNKTFIQI
jgi:hypothetical protein